MDDFDHTKLSAATAKKALQGGVFTTAEKHKNPRSFQSKAQFYLTSNVDPNWGVEDTNVKRRLHIFYMSQLATVDGAIAQWLKDNAFECVLWVGQFLRQHLDILPPQELFFHLQPIPFTRNERLVNEIDRRMAAGNT